MLQDVMILASVVLGFLLVREMWQRLSWFRSLVQSILTYGLVALAICTAILFAVLPLYPSYDAVFLIFIYMYGTPVVVVIAVIWGWVQYTKTNQLPVMWQIFNFFRALLTSIFTFGLGVFAICTAILFTLLPFFPSWDVFLLIFAYMYGTPVMVMIAVIWGWVIFSRRARNEYEAQYYGTQNVTGGDMKTPNRKQVMIDIAAWHNAMRQI